MNRRSFFGLMAVAPVAIAAAAPVVAAAVTPAFRAGMVGRVSNSLKELSLEEMEERYFRPAIEAWGKACDIRVAQLGYLSGDSWS